MKKTLAAFALAMVVTADLTWAGGAIGLSSPPSSAQVTAITVIADAGTFAVLNAGTISTGDSTNGSNDRFGTAKVVSNTTVMVLEDVNFTVFWSCNRGTGICTNNFGVASSGSFTGGSFTVPGNAGTAGSGTGISTGATAVVRHWVNKLTVINTALTAAGQTDITIWTTPVNTKLIALTADVTQVFTGGALSAMTVQCGNAAGGTQYLLANSVFTAQNTWGDANAEIGLNLIPGNAAYAPFGTSAAGIPGAIAISCRFICTGANCSAATQGSVTFEIEGVTYP